MGNYTFHDKTFEPYLDANAIANRVAALAQEIDADYKDRKPVLVVVLNGAFMFASDLAKNINCNIEITFAKLTSYEGTESSGKVKELIGLDKSIEGKDVIVVEDIVDTGITIGYIMDQIGAHNPASVEIATLLFKKEAYTKSFDLKYVGFEITNKFVVGYGLDYDGLGRNVDEILILTENQTRMLNIVLFGPPGAGKGTQSELLVERYSLKHLSTGDIFRSNINEGTELGKLAKSYMDKGQLVPDEVTINMLESELDKFPDVEGFIFDGFPRTEPQANALDALLSRKGTSITMMLALDVPEDELKTRLMHRAKTSGRPDDANPEVIQNRINVYKNETAPVKSFYEEQGKFLFIDGVGSVEDITARLFTAIDGVEV